MNDRPDSLRRVASGRGAWPLYGVAASQRIEAAALAASEPHALMQRAGLAVARLAVAVAPHAHAVTVLAGPGNNGGDGLVAARWLARLGRAVRVVHLADPTRLPADAARALLDAQAAGVRFDTRAEPADGDDLVVDALLGLGGSRAPSGAIAAAIEAVNATGVPILSVDLPTGLDAEHGAARGVAVQARWTLALLTLKPGLFTAHGRDHAGDVWLDDLGTGCAGEPPDALLGPAAWPPRPAPAARLHAQHKGSFGDVVVVGGAPGMQGALWLAARAALAAGAGRVHASPLDADAADDGGLAELMRKPRAWMLPPAELARCTVVCGCGGGSAVAATLPPLLAHAGRLVIDADALNAIAADTMLAAQLEARGRRGAPVVLTPHPLEAARLLGTTTAQVQADRLSSGRTLAARFGAVVVLKGSGTVIAAPATVPWINASGNPLLASPGTGDVLAGWIGGHWAATAGQGHTPLDVARHVVWRHGWAADRIAAQGLPTLRAGALIDAMNAAQPSPT